MIRYRYVRVDTIYLSIPKAHKFPICAACMPYSPNGCLSGENAAKCRELITCGADAHPCIWANFIQFWFLFHVVFDFFLRIVWDALRNFRTTTPRTPNNHSQFFTCRVLSMPISGTGPRITVLPRVGRCHAPERLGALGRGHRSCKNSWPPGTPKSWGGAGESPHCDITQVLVRYIYIYWERDIYIYIYILQS